LPPPEGALPFCEFLFSWRDGRPSKQNVVKRGVAFFINMVFNTNTMRKRPDIEADQQIIARLGGPSKLAELLGYDKTSGGVQRIQNWKKRGIPAEVKLQWPELFLPDRGNDTGRRSAPRKVPPSPAHDLGVEPPEPQSESSKDDIQVDATKTPRHRSKRK
jgi:hypothetical protein